MPQLFLSWVLIFSPKVEERSLATKKKNLSLFRKNKLTLSKNSITLFEPNSCVRDLG